MVRNDNRVILAKNQSLEG
ncbi:Protein of unknown function [Lactobacillus helveticus CIRM-BIA 953]|uniref:Uncharacterized protein n=1 Tax=Lactobacillus helveticus CIRM-BIA 953 TaxID=1226335 RepID=U4QLE2_LACHE|nr:Protein of unknown function [Lactobacillus helveticus CIRM-BIA 953]